MAHRSCVEVLTFQPGKEGYFRAQVFNILSLRAERKLRSVLEGPWSLVGPPKMGICRSKKGLHWTYKCFGTFLECILSAASQMKFTHI